MRAITKSSSLAIAALLAAASLASAGSVNLVANPSFEADNLGGAAYTITYTHHIAGWASDGPIEIDNTANDPGSSIWNGKAQDGNQMVELASDYPTDIFQSIPTVVGTTYLISFYYTSRDVVPNADSTQIVASFAGQSIRPSSASNGPSQGGSGISPSSPVTGAFHWDFYSFTATATSSSTLLSFAQEFPSTGSYGALLDNISVTAAASTGGAPGASPVPLPASAYGGAALLAGLAFKRARSRRA